MLANETNTHAERERETEEVERMGEQNNKDPTKHEKEKIIT